MLVADSFGLRPQEPLVNQIHLSWTIDCEATQKAVNDAALGERAVRAFCDILLAAGLKATLYVFQADARAYPRLLRELASRGFEIGLHVHPQEEGYKDYCGAYTADEQRKMYSEAMERLSDALGFAPASFRTGSCSANDATFPVTAELGFPSCSHSMPGRNMPNLRSTWTRAPDWVHRPHKANRLLEGDLNLIEVPITTDPDSMLWSGGHPQDLRVELFDAKNQRYMIDKMIAREKARARKTRAIVVLTHNVFDYSDPSDFRTQTMKQMIADTSELARGHEVQLVPATVGEIAKRFMKSEV